MSQHAYVYQTLVGAEPNKGQVLVVGDITDTVQYAPITIGLRGDISGVASINGQPYSSSGKFLSNPMTEPLIGAGYSMMDISNIICYRGFMSLLDVSSIVAYNISTVNLAITDLKVSKINGVTLAGGPFGNAFAPAFAPSIDSSFAPDPASSQLSVSPNIVRDISILSPSYTTTTDIIIGNSFTPSVSGLYAIEYSLFGTPGPNGFISDAGTIQFSLIPVQDQPQDLDDGLWTCYIPPVSTDTFAYKNTCFVNLTADISYDGVATIRSRGNTSNQDGTWSVAKRIFTVGSGF